MIAFLKALKDELVKKSDLVNYASGKTPKKYKCAACKITGIKLWREYQTFSPQLLCAECAIKDQADPKASSSFSKLAAAGKVVVDAEGKHVDQHGDRSDQIGWYVPAVPDEEGAGYWGYTSVPQNGVNWWKQLPTRK